ncbi:MATE family efflux transporter [Thalassotalea sp. LPB0316]|uniref:MATE family efflux transporter n=1 Tax=Thalassotalea sp. LPB0316 TaxID=2769490 RepID=UPI0018663EA5|nr:MATE family efflux transporter [Thalassotalea sp. LPB0316]QOL25071.1 MATE family efflux transporter [Thalassotalea sp. LPB0316]
MKSPHFIRNTKSLLKLAYPILIAQLIQNLMGFADTVMAGRVSSTDMAAVAVASSIWLPLILTIYGVIMALAAIVSQYSGKNAYDKVVNATYQTIWIALALGISVIAFYYLLAPMIEANVELEPQLKSLMFEYLGYIVWGAPGFCLYLVLRNYAEGMSFTRPTMIISIIGLIINIPANYIFIYGEFGMPALGGAGCGIATALVYWAMFFGMLIYVYVSKHLAKVSLFKRIYGFDFDEIKHILKVGVPIALSLLFEVSLFSIVAILLAPLGADIVASHQIAINFSGLVFMVPLSFAMALTIKVGYCVGQQKYQEAKEICKDALIFGLMIAVVTALCTIVFREQIAAIYTNEAPVIELAASLMFLAALFQFSDAIQVISAGALRGYKDTTSILIITFISYWFVGLSLGVLLALTDTIVPRMGAAGFWIGFISGLTVAAVLLAWRLKIIQSRYDNQALVG